MTDPDISPEDRAEWLRHLVSDAYHRADAMEHGDTYGDTPAALRRIADKVGALAAENAALKAQARENAQQYLALDMQAIEALAEVARLREAIEALLSAARQADGQEAHRIMPHIWPHIQALADLTAPSR